MSILLLDLSALRFFLLFILPRYDARKFPKLGATIIAFLIPTYLAASIVVEDFGGNKLTLYSIICIRRACLLSLDSDSILVVAPSTKALLLLTFFL